MAKRDSLSAFTSNFSIGNILGWFRSEVMEQQLNVMSIYLYICYSSLGQSVFWVGVEVKYSHCPSLLPSPIIKHLSLLTACGISSMKFDKCHSWYQAGNFINKGRSCPTCYLQQPVPWCHVIIVLHLFFSSILDFSYCFNKNLLTKLKFTCLRNVNTKVTYTNNSCHEHIYSIYGIYVKISTQSCLDNIQMIIVAPGSLPSYLYYVCY